MTIPHAILHQLRLAAVLTFVFACTGLFGYLWTSSGGQIPLVSDEGYRVQVEIPHASNLAMNSDVMVAGIPVGEVVDLQLVDGHAQAVMELDPQAVPLHQGATVRVRSKTLLQETFLEIDDGTGPAIPTGDSLPESATTPEVDVNAVLRDLDQPTRDALARGWRSLGAATEGSKEDISAALSGFGHLGREGSDAMDALADQSAALQRLTGQTAVLMAALEGRHEQIAQLVSDADTLTRATARGSEDLEQIMRELPPVLASTTAASDDLVDLSAALDPVAANLRAAGPELSVALEQLPATTRDLRASLPYLHGVLDRAPATFRRVPTVATETRRLVPPARTVLADINPMLAYLQPYGHDIAGFLTTSAPAGIQTGDGHWLARFAFISNEQSQRGLPYDSNKIVPRENPYPAPGTAENPRPFTGEYPHVEEGGGG
jgi:phospholipid/cholesterol/gamma-HCH transport system substrate-binding protein